MSLPVSGPDARRLHAELQTLAGFSEVPAPAVTRLVYSREDRAARQYLAGLFEAAGLEVRSDALGNTFARWVGTEPGLSPIGSGSHIDAIPNAGLYDGTVGVLGALEAVRTLQAEGFSPRRSIDVILFTSEEPTRFGIGCLGSRAMSGALLPAQLAGLSDPEGVSVDAARAEAGFGGALETARLEPGSYHAFLELHIEQGPLLEREGLDVGFVTHIAAPATLTADVTGVGGHAGALLMPDRRDALCAAAEITLAVERAVLDLGGADTVGTVGVLDVFPRAVNSVPSGAHLTIDVRDIDLERRDRVLDSVRQSVRDVAARRGVAVDLQTLNADAPATCAPDLVDLLEQEARHLNLNGRRLVSRAYHDSLFMARVAPTVMLFIPCRDGVSHRPDEYSSPEQIARGVALLARAFRQLAG